VLEYLLTLLVTAVVTYLLTPLVRCGAIAARAMQPARDRDVHTVPVPRLGGLAMYGGLAAGLMVARCAACWWATGWPPGCCWPAA
jgi:UDP-GlcNAc:undecaprenyl-phosphate/decaprenyl-phosphate GlcNAc-1-phosphate transferase